MDTSSRRILVTGGSRGIGAAVVAAFAAGGDRVAIHYRTSRALAEELRDSLPGQGHLTVAADLRDPDAVRLAVDRAAEQLGGLDVLVNNAADYVPHDILQCSYDEWQQRWLRVIDTNLTGTANVIWCAVQHMRAAGGGRIINISSRGAFRGMPDSPAYGASKAGLNALGQSLAIALAPAGIAVTTVAPGPIDTDLIRSSPFFPQMTSQSPFQRTGRVEEVAAAVHWLASPRAEWASGGIIDLNGASYLRT